MMEQFNLTKKLNIALIAEPVGKSGAESLTTLIKILAELSENLYVTTGNFPVERFNNPGIHITNVVNNPKDAEKTSKPAIIRKFISKQIRLSIAVIKVFRKADVFFFVGLSPVLPILLARIMGKKTIRIAAASLETHARLAFSTKSIFYHIPVFLERMTFVLPHIIAEYGNLGLERYGKKVFRISHPLFIDTTVFKQNKSGTEEKHDRLHRQNGESKGDYELR